MSTTYYIWTCSKCGMSIDTGTKGVPPSSNGCPKGGFHDWKKTTYQK